MANYTRARWNELQDYPGETCRIYSGPLACEHIAFIVNRQEPGSAGIMHAHDEAEEIYVLLQGRAEFLVDDDVVEAEPLDAFRVAAGVQHTTRNQTSEDALWLVIGAPPAEFVAWDPVAYGPPRTD